MLPFPLTQFHDFDHVAVSKWLATVDRLGAICPCEAASTFSGSPSWRSSMGRKGVDRHPHLDRTEVRRPDKGYGELRTKDDPACRSRAHARAVRSRALIDWMADRRLNSTSAGMGD